MSTSTVAPPSRRLDRWLAADLSAKAVLALLLAFSVWHRDWDRFADKAMLGRGLAYPLLVAIVPVAWLVISRHAGTPASRYPAFIAFLVTVPFVVDVAGNALDLYDRIDVFDDICHFVNWAILSAAVGSALARSGRLAPIVIAGLCTGFGAVTAIGWEVAEYLTFVTDTPEQLTLYRDTIGDLVLGLAGSLTAGLCFACVGSRRRPDVTRGHAGI